MSVPADLLHAAFLLAQAGDAQALRVAQERSYLVDGILVVVAIGFALVAVCTPSPRR